jgi:putative copper resistance protein D
VALSLSPFPREAVLPTTVLEQLTGYPEPPEFSFARAFGGVAIDPATFLVGAIALILYWTGVLRLSRRGDKWPWRRTLAWTVGVLIGLYVTNSMLGRYALVMISVHMGVHMALSMFAPIFLVLGAPVTLALRALKPSPDDLRGPREWLLAFVNAPATRFIANPLVAFVLWVGSAYALYLTGLFTAVMTDPLGHALMNAHFLIIGYLFFWNIIGIDPTPTPIPSVAKLGLLIGAIALHGFFGVIVMGSSTQIGGSWFFDVAPSWLASSTSDQQLAGGLAWAISEVPLLFVLIVLGLQWARGDAKRARQKERSGQADDELASYNEMLHKMGAPTERS